MITYSEIENLPSDHPKHIQFMKQLAEEDAMYDSVDEIEDIYEDEESLEYFNRFIAGDR